MTEAPLGRVSGRKDTIFLQSRLRWLRVVHMAISLRRREYSGCGDFHCLAADRSAKTCATVIAARNRLRAPMSYNTIGHLFRVTTWGESHGPSIGCVIDGCPPGIALAAEEIQAF